MGYIGQAHLRTTPRLRYLVLAVLVGALIASLMAVSMAAAADITVSNCLQLQHELSNAEQGDVITLAALCTKGNSGKAEGSFTLPSAADLTIQGQSGMTAGFEGAGVTKHALEGKGNGLVLRNLVVENYSLEHEAAVTLRPSEGALPEIESDRFVDDTNSTSSSSTRGGALFISASNSACAYTTPLSITSSLFQGDHIVDTSIAENNRDLGGAAYAEIRCNSASTPIDFAMLSGNTFAEDAVGTQAGGEAFGGALDLVNASAAEVHVSAKQMDNVFENDSITSMSPTGVYGGGGEWAPSLELSSTDDRFTGNSLPAPQGPTASSEGAGLGVITSSCSGNVTASATLDTAVVAANTIGPASGGGQSAGAGIYAACVPPAPNGYFHLTLNDSTVAGNRAPNGIAGIDGEDSDQLVLSNSIVTSPPGQADIGGFRPTSGGSLTSSFSDACEPDTGTPLPGQGNLCADPSLVSAETGDVHETYSSPTIDAGSNALVPGGLTTDVFGTTRILPGHLGCGGGSAAVVDMGAGEFIASAPLCPATVLQQPAPGLTHFISLKTSSTGAALRLSCSSTDGLGCSGTIFVTSDETLQGKKVVAVSAAKRSVVPVRIAQASFSLTAGSTATIQLKLNSVGLRLLRHFHAISAFVLANEASPTSTPFIFLFHTTRFSAPSKHKPRHSKHSKHH